MLTLIFLRKMFPSPLKHYSHHLKENAAHCFYNHFSSNLITYKLLNQFETSTLDTSGYSVLPKTRVKCGIWGTFSQLQRLCNTDKKNDVFRVFFWLYVLTFHIKGWRDSLAVKSTYVLLLRRTQVQIPVTMRWFTTLYQFSSWDLYIKPSSNPRYQAYMQCTHIHAYGRKWINQINIKIKKNKTISRLKQPLYYI